MAALADWDVVGSGVVVDSVAAMFPGLTWVGDQLLATYSTVPDGWPGGTVGMVHSADGGQTWTGPRTVVEPPAGYDAVLNAVGVTTLRDGNVLLPYNGVRWTPGRGVGGRVISLHLLRSTDGGQTWTGGDPIDIGFYGPCVYGRLVELADGRVLWPVWGQQAADERWRSVLLESADAGFTWKVGVTIGYDPQARMAGPYTIPEVGGLGLDGNPDLSRTADPAFRPHSPIDGFTETTVEMIDSGRLLAVLRQQGVDGDETMQMFRSESIDDAATWSAPQRIGFAGMSPLLHRTVDGSLLLASRRFVPGGGSSTPGGSTTPGVEFRVSHDGGDTWSEPAPLRDPHGRQPTAEYQCGYPAMVNLPDGGVLTVFYSYAPDTGRFVAWNTLRPVR